MKFAIYSRKSVYTGKGESIENQIELCKQYIFSKFPAAKDESLVIYEDEGFSGKNLDRPQYQQLFLDIQQKKFDCLVCYRLDRISRNVGDFAAVIEVLNSLDISFISIKENFDTTTPMGKAMLYIASVFAQLERETIAERVRDNMLLLARTGRWLGGSTPTGYTAKKIQKTDMGGKTKTSCILTEHPEEIIIIDTVFNKFLELRSISGVSKHLIAQDIKSRSGKIYSLIGIKDILQNPVYCTADADALTYFKNKNCEVCFEVSDCCDRGILSYNKRDYKKKSAPRLSMVHWIIAIGKHKGRISGEKWVAAQALLQNEKPNGEKLSKMHNDYALLSGLIVCGTCGSKMFAKPYSGKKGAFSYICNYKLRGGCALCGCENLEGRQTDALVSQFLSDYLKPSPDLCEYLKKLKTTTSAQIENPILHIDAKIKKITAEMDNLVFTLSQTDLTNTLVTRVNERIIQLEQQISALNAEKNRIENEQLLHQHSSNMKADKLYDFLTSFTQSFNNLIIQDKRALLKTIIQKLHWDGSTLQIYLSG